MDRLKIMIDNGYMNPENIQGKPTPTRVGPTRAANAYSFSGDTVPNCKMVIRS